MPVACAILLMRTTALDSHMIDVGGGASVKEVNGGELQFLVNRIPEPYLVYPLLP
jgi:hypothetical protein